MTFGDRLRKKRNQLGFTQEQVGMWFGIAKGNVSDWEHNKTSPEHDKLPILARRLRTSTDYLLGVAKVEDTGSNPTLSDNVGAAPEIGDQVPVISWVPAGQWDMANDPYPIEAIEEWVPCPAKHGSNAFALRVRGESMTAQYGHSYPNGCLIFVDPGLRSPISGQGIIAKLEGSDEVTFKVFVNEAGKLWLKPLNPQYPPILEPFKVLGTVLGKWEAW